MMSRHAASSLLLEFDEGRAHREAGQGGQGVLARTPTSPRRGQSISSAGAGLLKWVYAIVNYYGVAKTVNPKRQAVAQARRCCAQAEKELGKIQARCSSSRRMLLELKEKFEVGNAEQEDLRRKARSWRRASTPPPSSSPAWARSARAGRPTWRRCTRHAS